MPSSLKAGISLGHPPHPESSNDSAAPSARGARASAAAPAISVNKPQQQYQRYQSRHQLQQPAQHSGGCGPSRGCFRFGQHRHYLSECRAVLPTPKMFLTHTWAHKLPSIHILETTPILGAGLLHHHSQHPRRWIRMDCPFRPSRPRAFSPTRPP